MLAAKLIIISETGTGENFKTEWFSPPAKLEMNEIKIKVISPLNGRTQIENNLRNLADVMEKNGWCGKCWILWTRVMECGVMSVMTRRSCYWTEVTNYPGVCHSQCRHCQDSQLSDKHSSNFQHLWLIFSACSRSGLCSGRIATWQKLVLRSLVTSHPGLGGDTSHQPPAPVTLLSR